MSIFYVHRSQNHQKDSQVKQLFALSGSVRAKAVRKHVDEIDPRMACQLILSYLMKKKKDNNITLLNKKKKKITLPFVGSNIHKS